MSGQLHNLDAPPPAFTAEDATWITWEKYGIRSMALPLAGERDLNFRVTDAERRNYCLKIWNSTQEPAVVRFMLAAISHVGSRDPEVPVARVIDSLEGRDCLVLRDSEGNDHPAAMLSWLDGIFLRHVTPTSQLRSNLGATLARLDRALAGFSHPAQEREMLWDVCRTDRLRAMAQDIEDPVVRDLAHGCLDRFGLHTAPALGALRKQVIHNDFNPDNILVDPDDQTHVTGIIDFGDVLHAPLVCDLAIACAYQLSPSGDPVDDLLPIITGFHAVYPLERAELDILLEVVRARLLCTLLITTRMATLFPENREYLLGDNPIAVERLRNLERLDFPAARRRLRDACSAIDAGHQP